MKRFLLSLLTFIFVISLAACGGDSGSSSSSSGHLYDNAVVEDVKSGSGEVIGQYAYIKADSADVSIEDLADVYFNYFKENEFNWLMIVYTDKDEAEGCYMISGIVEDHVGVNDDGQYILGAEDNAVYYVPSEDGTLSEFE